MEQNQFATGLRKDQHIDVCLQGQVNGEGISNGFERYRFEHCALPELDFQSIDLHGQFLGKQLATPFLVSSMTGGTPRAEAINRTIAQAAQSRGWAMGLGSGRAALEDEQVARTFAVRQVAPDIVLIANLGAVQLNYGCGIAQCERLVDMQEADALVLHLNSMQEIFQDEGDVNFSDLLTRIEQVCRLLSVPVGVKEVGWGISGSVARQLMDAGVAFIDVAGAGGTSWSQVEKHRSNDACRIAASARFADWGIPTAQSLVACREAVGQAVPLIASGGIHHGVEAAKAIALGAEVVGFGRILLQAATQSPDTLEYQMAQIEWELRAAMFGIGAGNQASLRGHQALYKHT